MPLPGRVSGSPGPDRQHGRIHPRWRHEGGTGQEEGQLELETALPARAAGDLAPLPPAGGAALQHDVCPGQPGAWRHEPPEDRCRAGERRVGHDVKGATRQEQVGHVGTDDPHRCPGKAVPQQRQPAGVQLVGDHPCARLDERRRECSGSRPEIEDEGARREGRSSDEPACPVLSEAVPPPLRPPFRGHGT